MVEEELPLKQGLKPSFGHDIYMSDFVVEEELPLKQGLKQDFFPALSHTGAPLKRNFH
mgnify:CR=1 FL=1